VTDSFEWRKKEHSTVWWLRDPKDMFSQPLGLVAPAFGNNGEEVWEVAVWIPTEERITTIPRDTPFVEVLDTAKMLILLTLKQRGLV
jgi:hypothetical protein